MQKKTQESAEEDISNYGKTGSGSRGAHGLNGLQAGGLIGFGLLAYWLTGSVAHCSLQVQVQVDSVRY